MNHNNIIYNHELKCITAQLLIENIIEIFKYYGGQELKISHSHFFPDERYFQESTPIIEKMELFIRQTIEDIDPYKISDLEKKVVSSYVVLALANPILCKRNAETFDLDNAVYLMRKFKLSKTQIRLAAKDLMESIFYIYIDYEVIWSEVDDLLSDL